jgi:Group II intron, maturase-specific domain/Reverse transcriptase (RNA-dependent DNA polymerase)
LHGLEQAAGVRYRTTGSNAGETVPGSPVVIRYADDLIALCHSQRQAEQVKVKLAQWLAPRGLVFNEDKTRVVHLDTGCDFLGFNVRRYDGKLLIKPSKAVIQRIRERLRTEIHALRGSNAAAIIAALTPIIRGWAAYYRGVVSKRTFRALDDYLDRPLSPAPPCGPAARALATCGMRPRGWRAGTAPRLQQVVEALVPRRPRERQIRQPFSRVRERGRLVPQLRQQCLAFGLPLRPRLFRIPSSCWPSVGPLPGHPDRVPDRMAPAFFLPTRRALYPGPKGATGGQGAAQPATGDAKRSGAP